MANFHVPDLDKIEALNDRAIKMYAAIGAGISLTARIELSYISIFRAATELDDEMATRALIGIRNASTQRDIANNVMQHKLKNDPPNQRVWDKLHQRVVALTGSSGYRNLIAHLPVQEIRRGGGGMMMMGVGGSTPEYKIMLDRVSTIALQRGKNAPNEATINEILQFCRDAIALTSDLDNFLSQFP